MDIGVLSALVTALVALAGVTWTILNGRRELKRKDSVSLFNQATALLQSYKDDTARKDREIALLRAQVESLTHRINRLERRNARLMQALSKEDLIKLQLEDDTSVGPRL